MSQWQPRPDTPGLWWACAPGGVPEVFLVDRRGGEWVAVGIDYEDTFPLELFEGKFLWMPVEVPEGPK